MNGVKLHRDDEGDHDRIEALERRIAEVENWQTTVLVAAALVLFALATVGDVIAHWLVRLGR